MFHTQLILEKPPKYNKQTTNKEKSNERTPHDQLFKDLINNFFEEFLEAFFPDVHHHVDFTGIKPLPGEVHTDLLKGRNRRLDIVIETKLKNEDTIIIIHVEPQSYHESNFHERMYHYFSLLYNKYRKPILPIAVFSYDENHYEQDTFTVEFPFFQVLTFHFLMLELKKKNWRDYIESDNPVAAALLSKMGYKEEEKVQVKKEFLKMLVRMKLNPAESRFINDFFEIYLPLNEEEEEELMEEIKQLDNAEEILKMPNSWEERGIRKGIEKGIEKGKRDTALEMLKEGLPIELIARVTKLDENEIREIKESI